MTRIYSGHLSSDHTQAELCDFRRNFLALVQTRVKGRTNCTAVSLLFSSVKTATVLNFQLICDSYIDGKF